MFSKILVDYYGAPTPVNQLASFHVIDARMLTLTPYDKSARWTPSSGRSATPTSA